MAVVFTHRLMGKTPYLYSALSMMAMIRYYQRPACWKAGEPFLLAQEQAKETGVYWHVLSYVDQR